MSRREFRAGGREAPHITPEHALRLYWALAGVCKRIDKCSGSPTITALEHDEIESALINRGVALGPPRDLRERRSVPDPDGRDFDNLGESPDY